MSQMLLLNLNILDDLQCRVSSSNVTPLVKPNLAKYVIIILGMQIIDKCSSVVIARRQEKTNERKSLMQTLIFFFCAESAGVIKGNLGTID